MVDYGSLKDEIEKADRFNRILLLSSEVKRLKEKIPFSIYKDLESKANEKLHTFDYPFCDRAQIRIIYSNGLRETLDPQVCYRALQKGQKLSEYIFSNFVSARDYQILNPSLVGTAEAGTQESEMQQLADEKVEPGSIILPSKGAEILMAKIERLERIYMETIPKISKDIRDIKETLDVLSKKIDARR